MVWIAVDYFKEGVLEAREKCLESEALALSRLGVIYQKVTASPLPAYFSSAKVLPHR